MPQPKRQTQPAREWITGLVVGAATIIGLFGFARLSYAVTMVVSVAILVGLIAFFWVAGVKVRRTGHRPRR